MGAPFEDFPRNRRNFGAAYVFERTGGTWGFVQKLTVQFHENDVQFGAAVSLSGNRLVVGAAGEDLDGPNRGAAYVFTRSATDSDWTRSAVHAPEDRDDLDQFGSSVATNGGTDVIGAPFHGPGAAFPFVGGVEREPFTGEDASAGSQFGRSVAVSGDTLLVGGPLDDPHTTADAGSVAFCDIGPLQCNQLPSITKTGPAGAVLPGQEIDYTVVVTNACSSALPAAQIRDAFEGKLGLVKWCRDTKEGPATAAVCVPVLYTLHVRNQACHEVRAHVRDDFSPNLLQAFWCEGVGCTPSAPGPLDHTSISLPKGAGEEFHVQGEVSPLFQGMLPNTARVEPVGVADDHGADNEASVNTQVDLPPGFQLYCTGVDGPFAEGDAITCVFVLLNGGPSAQADNAGDEFTVTLPAGLTLVSASASSGSTSTFGNTATWNGAVPVGGRVDISVSATVNAGTAGTTICIQGSAFLDTDGDGVNDTVILSDVVDAPCPPPDPCCFRVLTPEEIPSLSPLGMAVLILLLAAGAVLRLRARRTG